MDKREAVEGEGKYQIGDMAWGKMKFMKINEVKAGNRAKNW